MSVYKTNDPLGDIEEEMRLRYVAVTRARHCLILSNGPREQALCDGVAWEEANELQGRRFDTIDEERNAAFRLYDLSFQQDYIMRSIREGDPLWIKQNALWHNNERLCKLASNRQAEFATQPLGGIYVSEIVRYEGFGEGDKYKSFYDSEVQRRGWCYIVNAAGYLTPE